MGFSFEVFIGAVAICCLLAVSSWTDELGKTTKEQEKNDDMYE